MKKGIYLCAREHRLNYKYLIYNDIEYFNGIDLVCDCLEINLSDYDFIIATPPCNYWSRANYRREISNVSLKTKHILIDLIDKCLKADKPFIIENVCNFPLFNKYNLLDKCYYFTFGDHTFWTNVLFLVPHKSFKVVHNKAKISPSKRNNNYNVDLILNLFLESVI